MTRWEVHGHELANCNCAVGCPCQFTSMPTHGKCEAVCGFEFDSGHYGDVDLGGTRAVLLAAWPGAIHQGNGTMQIIIDEKASQAQRDAIYKIMTGEDTEDLATVWWVYSKMSPNKLETLYKPIDLKFDLEARTGHISVPGVVETEAQPIKNPVTGNPHRARIDLPHGFEYRLAEVARATTKTNGGSINLNNNQDSHAHLVEIHLSSSGVLEAA